VPSPSHLTLSSDSGSLRDGKSRNDDKTDEEGSSPKSSQSLKVAGSKRKTPVSSEVESQTPSKRKKLDKKKAKEGTFEICLALCCSLLITMLTYLDKLFP